MKKLPNSIEAEMAVIGGCLIDSDVLKMLGNLSYKDFYSIECKNVFKVIKKLNSEHKTVDMITVNNEFKQRDNDNIDFLADCASSANPAQTQSYIDIILKTSTRRKLIKLGNTIIGNAELERIDPNKTINDIKEEVINISIATGTSKIQGGEELKNIMYEQLEYKHKLQDEGKDLIIKSHGLSFERGSHAVIGALPAHGKSMLLLALLLDMAQQGYKVLYVNIEMSQKQVMDRIYSYFTKTDSTIFKYLDHPDILTMIKDGEEKFAQIQDNFSMITKGQISSAEIYSTVGEMVMEGKIDVHGVDYLGILTEDRSTGKTEQVSLSSNTIRSIAKDFNTLSLTATQFNKGAYSGTPGPEFIKDASTIYDDADIFITLFRANEDDGLTPYTHEVIINKNRTGNLGTLYYKLDPAICEFKQTTN